MKYGFLGCGNMGGAIARALSLKTKDIAVTDRSGRAKLLAQELGVTYSDNASIASDCDRIFLAVKPHMMKDMLLPLRQTLAQRKPLLITMAAGLEIRQIEEFVGAHLPVIRIMPNTPAAIGQGVVQVCGRGVSRAQLDACKAILAPAGLVDEIDEKLIDAASCVSGCGPAFAYLFMEALADGGVACGLPREQALRYAAQMVAGSAEMVLQSGRHPGQLKDAVCSPGGTTIQGVRALEANGFRSAAMEAVLAAYEKTLKLGK